MSRRLFALTISTVLPLVALLAACGEAPKATPTPAATSVVPVATAAATLAMPTATVTKPVATPTTAAKMGGQLILIGGGDAMRGTFDIHYGGVTSWGGYGMAYESLLTHDMNTFETVPRLAERWEMAPDSKSITLYLRKGVKWQNIPPVNGREFTADDVKWNFDRIKNAKPPVDLTSFLAPVIDTQVIDRYTVKINFSQPFASIMWWLADPTFGMYPRELQEQYGDKQFKAMIGTGPFILKSYEPNTSLVYVRNPDYWQAGLPRVDTVKVVMIADAGARLAALRSGQGDMYAGLVATDLESIKRTNPEIQIVSYAGAGGYGLRLNCLAPPFNDVRVRQALHLALDRQELVRLLTEGTGQIRGHYGPTNGPYMRPLEELAKLPGYRQPKDADIAEAKRLLAEAGYSNGLTIKSLTISTGAYYIQANEIMVDQLKKLGITWQIEVVDYATISKRTLEAPVDFQASYQTFSARGDPDVSNAYGTASGQNVLGWGSKELDALLLKGQSEAAEAKRVPIYRGVEDKLFELVNNIPLHTTGTWAGLSPAIKDVRLNDKISGGFIAETYKYMWRTDVK